MADIPFYTIDAFTKTPFKGNQAAVCILHPNKEPSKDKKQLLAAEFHLSETAFPSPLNETGEDAFEKGKFLS
jgi:PhzF family phenazine biosynthesis protein